MPLILHLSDLHFRKRALSDVDEKTSVEFAAYDTWHENAKSTIQSLEKKPDFVIVSGDIRYRNDADSFPLFNEFCDELIGAGVLPDVDHFMVVPGNHDVDRVSVFGDADETTRWKAFAAATDRFPHAWIPTVHSKEAILEAARSTFKEDYAGGVLLTPQAKFGRATVIGLPFVFDPNAGVLIYGFNSAAISGGRVTVPPDVKNAITWLNEWRHENAAKWQTVCKFIENRVRVDAAQVRPDELDLFRKLTAALQTKYGEAYERAAKIAVLHHHVAPMPAQEVKDFELLLNASDFKREIAARGFSIICHGHKHRPCAFRDAGDPVGAQQVVFAGGTIGGDTPRAVSPGFYLLDLDDAQITSEFVPIDKTSREPPQRWVWDAREAPKPPAPPPHLNVKNITDAAVSAMIAAVCERTFSPGKVIHGWPHRVGDSTVVTATSTGFALRVLRLSDPLPADALRLVGQGIDTLRTLHYDTGGWASRYEVQRGTPESTSWAVLALRDWGIVVAQDEVETILRQLLDPGDEGGKRIVSIAQAARVLAEIYPDSELLPLLIGILDRGAIREDDRVIGWPARLGDGNFSAVHTAYACIALLRAAGKVPAIDLTMACDALLSGQWRSSSDEVGRRATPTEGRLLIKHYAPAIVVGALLEFGVEPRHPTIVNGVTEIAAAQRDGLWADPDDHTKPIWMTYHAVAALHAWARRL